MRPVLTLSMVLVLGLAAACGSKSAPPPPAGGGKKVDAATAGKLTGRVTFAGTAPAREFIRMSTDKACVQDAGPNPQSDAVLVGADGSLQNTFVYVKAGLDSAYSFDVPTTPVTIDQHGCHYTPRVLGVRAGQAIQVVNSDDTLHNVHAMPMSNQEFNQSTASKGASMSRTFTVPEVMVRFKCDVHGWMAAWVGVVAHPFFAVTAADGSFAIDGLPPGTYTIGAWHEKFGDQTQQVTIAEHESKTLALSFAAK